MTTALERIRQAISEGDDPSDNDDDTIELLEAMPIELQKGIQRLIVGIVATFHSNGGPGVEDWMGETVEEHLRHANDHATVAHQSFTKDEPDEFGNPNTEDGLRHVDHAACRIAMAFARERMAAEKKGSE